MDVGLLWTAVGSAAGVLGVVLVAGQIRLQLREHRTGLPSRGTAQQVPGPALDGFSIAVPLGRLPAEIRGRDVLLAELRRQLARQHKVRRLLARRQARRGRTWVIAGMGGLGKSTMALAVARFARANGWRVWWVTC